MTYCVNCGVQLNNDAAKCPLCDTIVLHPGRRTENYAENSHALPKQPAAEAFDRGLWSKLISITLLTPVILSILVDWLFNHDLSWSLYAAASLIFVWSWSITLFIFKQNRLLKWNPFGAVTILIFLFTIEKLSGAHGWFLTIALPITIAFFTLLTLLTFFIRNNFLRELQIPAAIIFAIGIFCILIDGSISLYTTSTIKLDWSLIMMTTCTAFGLVGLVLQQRPWIVEELKHWFRV